MIFISISVYVCNFQDNCPLQLFCSCICQKPNKNPKNLWQKPLKIRQKPLTKIFDKNSIKIWDI